MAPPSGQMRKLRHQAKQELPNWWLSCYWPAQWFSSLAACWCPPGTLTNTYAGIPLQNHHVRLLGKGAGIGICKSSHVVAMMVRGAWRPGCRAAQAGGADFPGWWGMYGLGDFITVNSLLPRLMALGMKILPPQRLRVPNPGVIQSGLVIPPRRLNSPLFLAHF